jgi:hypothetical protein
MKKIIYFLFSILLLSVAFTGCKKELQFKPEGTAAFIMVNGLVNNTGLVTNFNGEGPKQTYFSIMKSIPYAYSNLFNNYSGEQQLALYQLPDTLPNSKPVISLNLNLPVNTMHTLFVMGTAQDPDHLFIEEKMPYHETADSVMAIRFINMSEGTAAITVNLAGKDYGSEVNNLAYKSLTAFKNYPANSTVNSYTFEFRDKASGTLLGTCLLDGVNTPGNNANPNLKRNRNLTLAFLAQSGGMAFDRVLMVDHYVY